MEFFEAINLISKPPTNDFYLSDLFIRSWCQIYDLRGKIGFAKAISSS
jgi:hypothetical protein